MYIVSLSVFKYFPQLLIPKRAFHIFIKFLILIILFSKLNNLIYTDLLNTSVLIK